MVESQVLKSPIFSTMLNSLSLDELLSSLISEQNFGSNSTKAEKMLVQLQLKRNKRTKTYKKQKDLNSFRNLWGGKKKDLATRELGLPSSLALGDFAFSLFDVALHLSLLHDSVLNVRLQSFLQLLHEPIHHRFYPQRHLRRP